MHCCTMICKVTLVIFCCCSLLKVQAAEQTPRIIIVGSGAAGIAAASQLLQNGFNNITIFEAENRIGGRVYTTKFGDYWVDVGGQWVHGEKDNVAYELAWPLGLIEHSVGPKFVKFFSSSGPTISEDAGNKLMAFYFNMSEGQIPDEYLNRSIGEFYTSKINKYFDAHPEITANQRKSLGRMFNLFEMVREAGNSWFEVSVHREDIECEGDQMMNWKERGYSTILDILMKRYPDPAEELPVLNNTILNTEVAQIKYNITSGSVRVVTANGNIYPADHVIVTTSVGVLKSDHKKLFKPLLPEEKVNAIENIELGSVAKIYLLFSEPWWIEPNRNTSPNNFFNFLWTDADRREYASDPEKSWMLSIVSMTVVEHKSRLLCCWLTGPLAREMENFSADRVFELMKEFLHRFLGRSYSISEPVAMLRSNWFTNKHFRGTWSHRSLKTERSGAKAIDLEEPIMTINGEPLVLFAGEATHSKHPSTVHGAIDSGWREATRLTQLYAGRRFLGTHTGEGFWRAVEESTVKNQLISGSWRSVVARRQKSDKS